MPELVSIEEAARIIGFPYKEIEDWVKPRKTTSFRTRTGTRTVGPESLRDFIAHIEHLGVQELHLQLIIQGKEEGADEIIAQYDDYLLCLRSLKSISPLPKQIIAELSTFIGDKQDRYMFTEITSGVKTLDVAKHCGVSYDKMCYRYKNMVLRLQENTGFLTEYKKTVSCQDLEIERLRLEKRNVEYELRTLYKTVLKSGLSLDASESSLDIPADAARRISLPVTNLTLSPYIRKYFRKLESETMEDLLRYVRKKGLDSLLKTPGFDPLDLDQLKFQLEKHKIMNKAGDSDLYQYIINEPDS